MIHGFGAFTVCFNKLLSALAKKFYIILIDLPGMGLSTRPEKLKHFTRAE